MFQHSIVCIDLKIKYTHILKYMCEYKNKYLGRGNPLHFEVKSFLKKNHSAEFAFHL